MEKRRAGVWRWMILLAGVLAATIVGASDPAQCLPVHAQPANADVRARITEIKGRWAACRPHYEGDPFTKPPHISAPFEAGELALDFVGDALNVVNFARYLVGLSNDVTIDPGLANRAQHGAVTMAGLSQMTHSPGCPAGMDADFYRIGKESCGSSNIAWNSGDTTLAHSVMMWLDDGCGKMGHRRWLLHPPLQRTGFGFARSGGGSVYSNEQVMDASGRHPLRSPYVAYPTPTAFPVEFLSPGAGWTISLNEAVYARTDAAEIRVRLERLRDRKVWDLRLLNGASSDTGADGSYLSVDSDGYGIPNCIIFRPGGVGSYADGDEFTVSVAGLRTRDGGSAGINYDVTFFRLE